METDAHKQFVDELRSRGVFANSDIESAFRHVPRHCFLPNVSLKEVYSDRYVVVGQIRGSRAHSSSTQPSFMAKMLGQLGVDKGQRVLEIGTATGFNAALLSSMLGPQGLVVTIEFDPELVTFAADNLTRFGYTDIPSPPLIHSEMPLRWLSKAGSAPIGLGCGDGWNGVPLSVPFDRLISAIGSCDISPAWIRQTSGDGRLVVPLTLFPNVTLSIAFDRIQNELVSRSIISCSFVPARGRMAARVTDWSKVRVVARPSPSTESPTPFCTIQTLETNLQMSISTESGPLQ